MQNRFVIHLHSGYGPEHFDLMLQQGPALATWQLSRPPGELAEGQAMPARRIADHRLAYLHYEGPVSRGRGKVARLDAGACEIICADESRWEFRLAGEKLRGRFELKRREGADDWTFERLSDSPRRP